MNKKILKLLGEQVYFARPVAKSHELTDHPLGPSWTSRFAEFRHRSAMQESLDSELGWGKIETGLAEIWSQSKGEGIVVAMLDTGCDINHPDLAGQIIMERNFTSGEEDFDVDDYVGHGTHCAGIVAAIQDGKGVVGMAPKAKLMIGKVLNDKGYGQTSWITAGIYWAVDSGAHVISMSLGGPGDDPAMDKAIQYAYDNDVVVVAAAGNSGEAEDSIGFPGSYENVMTIGSLDSGLARSYFSATGPSIDFMAPGRDILSTYPEGKYTRMSGTSMATPLVAGLVALLLSHDFENGYLEFVESRAYDYVHNVIRMMCIDLEDEGFDNETGYGVPVAGAND